MLDALNFGCAPWASCSVSKSGCVQFGVASSSKACYMSQESVLLRREVTRCEVIKATSNAMQADGGGAVVGDGADDGVVDALADGVLEVHQGIVKQMHRWHCWKG